MLMMMALAVAGLGVSASVGDAATTTTVVANYNYDYPDTFVHGGALHADDAFPTLRGPAQAKAANALAAKAGTGGIGPVRLGRAGEDAVRGATTSVRRCRSPSAVGAGCPMI